MKEWLQLNATEVLRDAEDDWIMIDNVIAYGWEGGTRTNEDPRQATVELLRFLLNQDLMLIGDLGDAGFEAGHALWTRPSRHSSRVVIPATGNRSAHFGGSKSRATAGTGLLGQRDSSSTSKR